MTTRRDSGQVLVLFAIVSILLMGLLALVVDVGLKYTSERRYQAVADGASLAGAQELQPTSRTAPVTPLMQTLARERALRAAVDELLETTVPLPCLTDTDIVDCLLPGGRFSVSVKTPSPTCVECVPERSVQVTVAEPSFSTMFSRLFGQTTWALSRTSVAGLSFGRSYTIVTLRPPQPHGMGGSYDVRDFRLSGGTNVHVSDGDVGTNSNMTYEDASGGTKLHLATGYSMYYYDPYNDPEWAPPNPPDPDGKKIGALIKDPGYVIPGAPSTDGSIANEDPGSPCETAAISLLASAAYGVAPRSYIPALAPTTPDMDKITCLLPGNYDNDPLPGSLKSNVIILLRDADDHGLFYFADGLSIQSSLIGGYEADQPGVAIVVPQDQEMNVNTNGSSRPTAIMLNAGTKTTGGSEAGPALDFAGNPIVTNTSPAIKMTLMVTRDPSCIVPNGLPTLCTDTHNDAISIAGQSDMYLAGVQFMPSDNSDINSSAATGYIGQIWAWTLKYSGGVTLSQQGAASEGPGRIRIDTACSPGVGCNP